MSFHPNRWLPALTLFLLPVATLRAADAKPQTGSFQVHVPERSKNSQMVPLCARLGWGTKVQLEAAAKQNGTETDYDLANETFEAFVPEDYTGAEPYGLIVWISPGPTGGVHQPWFDVLRKHKLIWIGANKSGNNRTPWVRIALAMDGLDYMQKQYKIDPNRVYSSGASGGGRCASTIAFGFPELITGGGYPIIGINFYRRVEVGPAANGGTEFYPQGLKAPPGKLAQVMKKERRFVLLTGDNDMNQKETKLYAEAMKKDGFRYMTYIQVPGMGHQPPNAEWFEKGIVALDEPLNAAAKGEQPPEEKKPDEEKAPVAAAAKAKAPAAPKAAAPAPAAQDSAEDEADKLMRLARLYVDNRLYKKAREKLNELIKDHPSSPHVTEAKKLLKEIGTN
jgi:dienelactone hydrolase